MDIFIWILIVVCLWGVKFSITGHSDYISRSQTDSIKGIFAIIILYSHMRGYFESEVPYSIGYNSVLDFLGQLMVVMFLLYSGYGVMEALKRNPQKYRDTFLSHRIGKVWLMFAIAVALYLTLNVMLSIKHEPIKYFTCWIGWDDIGNSNWFVFDILALYIITYITLIFFVNTLCADRTKGFIIMIYVLTFIVLFVLKISGKGSWWYDTVLAYPTGMLYAAYKNKIEHMVQGRRYWVVVSALAILFLFCRFKSYAIVAYFDNTLSRQIYFIIFVFTSSIFAVLVVLLTMKIKIDNQVLRWLGTNAFAIYILQRLLMILGTHLGWNTNAILFACFVVPTTLLISAIYTAVTNKLNKKLFR